MEETKGNGFDLDRIKKVGIDEVRPNSWNPKEKQHQKVKDIEKSIKMHGFKQPIQTRSNDGYEIIDGEQRWTAMKNLGATHIYIYDNGEVSDEDAQNETLWWQVQVPFEPIGLTRLVVDLEAKGMELPYTAKEIQKMKEGLMKDPNSEEEDKTRLNIKLSPDQYEVVKEALETVKAENECQDARALELICADYLSGV
jgi:ParB-like nuclease family protein